MIYLDYAANTPAEKCVIDCFCNTEVDFYANPNSTHPLGIIARNKLDEITNALAKNLNVSIDEIIYISGASEANNLAIKGIANSYKTKGKHIISTCLEHSSVSGCLTFLQEQGYEIDLVDINKQGQVDLTNLKELLREDTILVSVCTVDSELGIIQPIKEIYDILKHYPNCHFHTDATQAVGKIQFDFNCADLITFAPHKFYGLNGSGVLIKKPLIQLTPLIHGSINSNNHRSGTPSLAHAVALEKAVFTAFENLEQRFEYVNTLNNYLIKKLNDYPLVIINSTEKSSPFILNLSVKGVKSISFKNELELHGICISTKSACSSDNTPSRAVYALTHDKKNALSSWRISLSHLTSFKELDEFIKIFDICYNLLIK